MSNIKFNCECCGKESERYSSPSRKKSKFCSKSCASQSRKHSIETREKISKSNKGQVASNKGSKMSDEQKEKISKAHKGREILWSDKISKTISYGLASGRLSTSSINRGTYKEEKYDSGFELTRMKFLDESSDVAGWTKNHGIVIDYTLEGKHRRYTPDFLILLHDGTVILDEVKGWIRNQDKFDAKCMAAKEFCSQYDINYTVTFQDGLNGL